MLDRVYKLGVSLPDAPLTRFRAQTAGLPQTTEIERLVVQRIGQDIFRAALMDYWGARCPITGITDPALLRASHIVPWAKCADAQRLDVHNGLLLSALWDAAFDTGLVSFADDGTVLASPELSAAARTALDIEGAAPAQPARRPPHQPRRSPHPLLLFRRTWPPTGGILGGRCVRKIARRSRREAGRGIVDTRLTSGKLVIGAAQRRVLRQVLTGFPVRQSPPRCRVLLVLLMADIGPLVQSV